MKKQNFLLALLCLTSAGAASAAPLTPYVLRDLTTEMDIAIDNEGVLNWRITRQGVQTDVMYEEGFWYRVGTDTQEHRLTSVPITFHNASDTNANPGDDVLNVTYRDETKGFTVDLRYSLQGSAFGCCSDLAEQLTITNISDTSLQFTLFEYTDFDIGDIDDGVAFISGGNTFVQQDNEWRTETVVGPTPDAWEIAYFDETIRKLVDGKIDNLSNKTSPLLNGDLTWAAQWNFVLPAKTSVAISKDKLVTYISPVPLPASGLMLAGALVGLGSLRRFLSSRG